MSSSSEPNPTVSNEQVDLMKEQISKLAKEFVNQNQDKIKLQQMLKKAKREAKKLLGELIMGCYFKTGKNKIVSVELPLDAEKRSAALLNELHVNILEGYNQKSLFHNGKEYTMYFRKDQENDEGMKSSLPLNKLFLRKFDMRYHGDIIVVEEGCNLSPSTF